MFAKRQQRLQNRFISLLIIHFFFQKSNNILSPGKRSRRLSHVGNLWQLNCDSVWPRLPWTCDGLRTLWSSLNLHASERKFFTVWPPRTPPNASRRKLASVLVSFVRARVQGCIEMALLLLALNLRILAGRFGHQSQVSVPTSTFLNWRWLTTQFGQGFTSSKYLHARTVCLSLINLKWRKYLTFLGEYISPSSNEVSGIKTWFKLCDYKLPFSRQHVTLLSWKICILLGKQRETCKHARDRACVISCYRACARTHVINARICAWVIASVRNLRTFEWLRASMRGSKHTYWAYTKGSNTRVYTPRKFKMIARLPSWRFLKV